MKHKLRFLLIGATLFALSEVHAQYYLSGSVAPGNPLSLNTDSDVYFATVAPPPGSTVLVNYPFAKNYSLQYTPVQTIPFTFKFDGVPVTKYKISTSGYITFKTSSVTPVGPNNTALPAAALPDSTICVWGLAGASDGGQVYTKVYGSSPNRQLWIVYWFAGNPSDTNSQNVWAIVLQETTNNIYMVDMWGNITNGKVYNPLNLTVGVQVNASNAFQVAASPKLISHTWTPGNTDNIYYEFSPNPASAYTPQKKEPLFEEFMQASCHPCFLASPNIDSVLTNNVGICNPVRYHVWYPGVDYMDSVTYNSFVYPRTQLYYNVAGVPDGKLDGSDIYPGGGYFNSLSSVIIRDDAAIGSPFSITITSAQYDPISNKYSVSADIKAFYPFSKGLIAQAMLTVDTIKYKKDQSTEDPGNNSKYLLDFPNVAEDMLPSSNGTVLDTFSVGQTQTINLSWTKDHPWGSSPKTAAGKYDSTSASITIFVQNNGTQYVYQSASAPFSPVLGDKEISGASYFEIYPNPMNNSANIAYSLDKEQNVNIEMFNLLGEKVYGMNPGTMSAGTHITTIDKGSLKPGIYFVRFSTGENVMTKKLVIQ